MKDFIKGRSMKIIQVGIHANRDINGKIRVGYENFASCITLTISDWIKDLKIDLGDFNRILFTEADIKSDLKEVGIKAFNVFLAEEFHSLDQFNNAEVTHQYFKRKYVEGFKRFDAHFGLNLTPELETFLNDYFKNGYVYEKEMKSKRINGLKHQVLKQYKFDVFNLVLRVLDKSGAMVKETILQSSKPDPFLVHYNVNKVNILDDKIEVLGSTGKVEAEYSLIMH
jgi:hypothetical protein